MDTTRLFTRMSFSAGRILPSLYFPGHANNWNGRTFLCNNEIAHRTPRNLRWSLEGLTCLITGTKFSQSSLRVTPEPRSTYVAAEALDRKTGAVIKVMAKEDHTFVGPEQRITKRRLTVSVSQSKHTVDRLDPQGQGDSRGVALVAQFGENARNWECCKKFLPSKLTCTERTSTQSSQSEHRDRSCQWNRDRARCARAYK